MSNSQGTKTPSGQKGLYHDDEPRGLRPLGNEMEGYVKVAQCTADKGCPLPGDGPHGWCAWHAFKLDPLRITSPR